jgi:hypothetical protein
LSRACNCNAINDLRWTGRNARGTAQIGAGGHENIRGLTVFQRHRNHATTDAALLRKIPDSKKAIVRYCNHQRRTRDDFAPERPSKRKGSGAEEKKSKQPTPDGDFHYLKNIYKITSSTTSKWSRGSGRHTYSISIQRKLCRLTLIDKTLLVHDSALHDLYQKLLPLLSPPPEPPRRGNWSGSSTMPGRANHR